MDDLFVIILDVFPFIGMVVIYYRKIICTMHHTFQWQIISFLHDNL